LEYLGTDSVCQLSSYSEEFLSYALQIPYRKRRASESPNTWANAKDQNPLYLFQAEAIIADGLSPDGIVGVVAELGRERQLAGGDSWSPLRAAHKVRRDLMRMLYCTTVLLVGGDAGSAPRAARPRRMPTAATGRATGPEIANLAPPRLLGGLRPPGLGAWLAVLPLERGSQTPLEQPEGGRKTIWSPNAC
jgi:hypothetical protein